jgi:DNA-binding NarL/FixJ family response regulator
MEGRSVNEQTGESRIRLVLLDNQALFRTSLGRLLASQSGLEVVRECSNCAEALEVLRGSPVDVVLVDFDHATEGRDGFMPAARRNGYRGRFLVVAGAADVRDSAMAIRLGASGVFLKTEPPERLVQAITFVANGAAWLDQRVIRLLAAQTVDGSLSVDDQGPASPLTDRDKKVLLGILEGLTNRRIGDELGISEGSVKASVQHLFQKAGVRTRGRLVRAALEGSLGTARARIRPPRSATAGEAPSNGDEPHST